MTEEEAKATTCHKTLAPLGGSDGVSSWCSPQPCLASACMAWRWLPRGDYRGGPYETVTASKKPPEPTNPHHYWLADNPTQETWGRFEDGGYCGLAGKP